jgi:hypothetical protein
MSQNCGNGEQVEAATKTIVAATIVTSIALYLIYKKKLVQCNGYNCFSARFKKKCWKYKKLCMSLLLIIIFSLIFLRKNGFSLSFPNDVDLGINLAAIERKQEEKHTNHYDGPQDQYGCLPKKNAILYPQLRPRNLGW